MEPVPTRYLMQQDLGIDLDAMFEFDPSLAAEVRRLKPAAWRPEMLDQGKMVVYANVAQSKETIVPVRDLGAGAGETPCWDCAGSGVFEEPDGSRYACPSCKGSGFVLISIP
jgi:hypothetical protein